MLTTIGQDIHKFTSAKSFAGWLRLVPNNKVSGGRIISHRNPWGKSYLASALRGAANSIGNQKNHELRPFLKKLLIRNENCRYNCQGQKVGRHYLEHDYKAEPYEKGLIKANNQK